MEEKYLQKDEPEAERNSQFQTRNDSSNLGVTLFAQWKVELLKNKHTFGKNEKLKSKKIIEQLFKEGKSVSNNRFTLVYLQHPLNTFYPAQAGFSVPKKYFKQAVDRNRIKRLMRESYRLHKNEWYAQLAEQKKQFAIMFIYKGDKLPSWQQVSKSIAACLTKLNGV